MYINKKKNTPEKWEWCVIMYCISDDINLVK